MRSCSYDFVCFEPKGQLLDLEDLLDLTDQLHRKLLLPYIVIALYYKAEEAPRFQVAEGAVFTDALFLLEARLLYQDVLLSDGLILGVVQGDIRVGLECVSTVSVFQISIP